MVSGFDSMAECLLNLITVNGIRNPFQYQPWQNKKSFEAMFDILEADIVIFQETKIQRKDLKDDMVLVRGWDCYWSLPRHKKGKRATLNGLVRNLTPGRLFRSGHLYEAICLRSYPCRRRNNRHPLPTKIFDKLFRPPGCFTNRRLSHSCPTSELRYRCNYH